MFDQRQYLQTDRSEGSYGDVGITSARDSCRGERGRLPASSVRVRLQSGGARVGRRGFSMIFYYLFLGIPGLLLLGF